MPTRVLRWIDRKELATRQLLPRGMVLNSWRIVFAFARVGWPKGMGELQEWRRRKGRVGLQNGWDLFLWEKWRHWPPRKGEGHPRDLHKKQV